MFAHPTTVVFLTKGIAHITFVANARIVKTVKQAWDTQTLAKLFTTIKESVGSRAVRILLADEFSYILELDIPIHVLNKRLHIEQQLKTHIPEILHSNEWDYKEIPSKSKEKKALVFAPVKYVYDALLKASEASGLHIEAVEPVQIAGRRHKNPVVGLAIKTDLKGKDEEVLNVIPTQYIASTNTSPDDNEVEKNSQPYKIWIILAATLLLIVGCVYIIYSQFTKPRNIPPSTEEPTPTIETSLSPTSPPEETPTPTEEVTLDPSAYTVQVLNGSGVIGVSTEVKNLLEAEGFEKVTTGNADNYDYTATIIRHKSSVPSQIVPFLSEVLSEYDIEESDPLTTDESYDVLIIVGKKI